VETATQKIPNAFAAVIVFPLIVVITAKSMKLAWAVTSMGVGGLVRRNVYVVPVRLQEIYGPDVGAEMDHKAS
jgi:hypothetical protein